MFTTALNRPPVEAVTVKSASKANRWPHSLMLCVAGGISLALWAGIIQGVALILKAF